MILLIECIIGCLIFGCAIVGSVLVNKEFWIQEYSVTVQQRYMELHPEYKPSSKSEETKGIVIKKIICCILFICSLFVMVWIAGARDFLSAFIDSYIIWFVVNLFDLVVLDIGILAHWKKARLEGTEDMDSEYRANYKKCCGDFFYGLLIGILVALVVGGIAFCVFK